MKNIFRKVLMSVVCLALFMSVSVAETLSISGTVVDAKTNEPLSFANVQVTKPDGTAIANKGCRTDDKGAFSAKIKDVPNDAKIVVSYVGYAKQTLTPGQDMRIKMEPKSIDLKEVRVEAKICSDDVLTKLHATAGRGVQEPGRAYCVPTDCVDQYELQGGVCVQNVVAATNPNGNAGETPTVPGAKKPNDGSGETPTVPAATDPNIAVTPVVVNPGGVTPASRVATCETPIKVDAVRSALANAPADMDKQKFMDILSTCNVVTVCELLEACVKSVPAAVACKECEKFIRDIVGYHNG